MDGAGAYWVRRAPGGGDEEGPPGVPGAAPGRSRGGEGSERTNARVAQPGGNGKGRPAKREERRAEEDVAAEEANGSLDRSRAQASRRAGELLSAS